MSTATYVRTRVDPEPFALGLAMGDAAAIVAFAAAGVTQHGGDPVGDPAHVLLVAAPFLIGWGLAAFLGGLYTRDAITSPRRALSWAIPAWVVATLLGHALRSTAVFQGGTELTFVLVTLAFGGVLVLGWRVLAALVVERA
jgi:hypothetical protein